MYRLVPSIPILGGGGRGVIKSVKRMCICDYVKHRIGTCKNVFFGLKKGYKQINIQDSPKTYC